MNGRTVPVLAALLLGGAALAAVETTTVQGTVYLPDGITTATAGVVRATLSAPCSADDGTGLVRVAMRADGDIDSSGGVNFDLVPNDVCVPSDTYYRVEYRVTAPIWATWTEKWSVATSPDPVYIGAVTRLEVAPGISCGTYAYLVSAAATETCDEDARGHFNYIEGAAGVADELFMCMKTAGDVYSWVSVQAAGP